MGLAKFLVGCPSTPRPSFYHQGIPFLSASDLEGGCPSTHRLPSRRASRVSRAGAVVDSSRGYPLRPPHKQRMMMTEGKLLRQSSIGWNDDKKSRRLSSSEWAGPLSVHTWRKWKKQLKKKGLWRPHNTPSHDSHEDNKNSRKKSHKECEGHRKKGQDDQKKRHDKKQSFVASRTVAVSIPPPTPPDRPLSIPVPPNGSSFMKGQSPPPCPDLPGDMLTTADCQEQSPPQCPDLPEDMLTAADCQEGGQSTSSPYDAARQLQTLPRLTDEDIQSVLGGLVAPRPPDDTIRSPPEGQKYQCVGCRFEVEGGEIGEHNKEHDVANTTRCWTDLLEPYALRKVEQMGEGYSCKFPGCTFQNHGRIEAVEHVVTHHLGLSFRSNICDRKFQSFASLNRHLINQTLRPTTTTPTLVPPSANSAAAPSLNGESSTAHASERLPPPPYGETLDSLNWSQEIHEALDAISKANNTAQPTTLTPQSAKDLLKDIRGRTPTHLQYQCVLCSSKFPDHHKLKRHLFTTHVHDPSPCPQCMQVYLNPERLRRHRQRQRCNPKLVASLP